MDIRVNGIVQDSIVDGPGLRLAVFVQGCSHRCPGCHNPDTHDPTGGQAMDTAQIISQLAENPLLDGLTLSGGEPFEQPAACLALAEAARARGLNVWAYSGYPYEALLGMGETVQQLLRACDVLVDGPFVLSQRSLELDFRGSANQRLIDLVQTRRQGRVVLWERAAW
ncbi:MAG: anaerobic ribonucleoside-triphosphate reductase activating protein [Clostridiales bacterium]|nr:anaerobic ribonucleoside-triphosphate reductase activating protein [Clostridiales bacterium]